MKHLITMSMFLLLVSLGCRAVQRIVSPTTPAPALETVEIPGDTANPSSTFAAPSPITCEDDSCLDRCLDRIKQQLSTQSQDDVGGNYAGTEASFNLVNYTIEGDQILEPDILWVPSEYKAYQEDAAAHQRVWNYFISLIPSGQRKWITRYTIFTDGSSNTLAWVGKVEYDDNSRWELGVDILDSTNPIYLTETLTHEVAHLITLNSEQLINEDDFIFTPHQNTAVCSQFISTEGCSTPESYINRFYQEFWTGIYEDWMEIVYNSNPANDDELFEAVETFYEMYPKHFKRTYAATSIKEDMAVSFEHFILEAKPGGNGITNRKIRFYYDFPELVSLRKQMIQAMCSYVN